MVRFSEDICREKGAEQADFKVSIDKSTDKRARTSAEKVNEKQLDVIK